MVRLALRAGFILLMLAPPRTPSLAQPLQPPPLPQPGDTIDDRTAAPLQPGYLGLVVEEGTVRGQGVLVRNVDVRGPAQEAGLRTGDLLTRIGGREIHDVADFGLSVVDVLAGEVIEIEFERDGIQRQVDVTLTERPAPEDRLMPRFGRVPAQDGPREQDRNALSSEAEPVLLGVLTATVSEGARRRLNLPHRRGALVVAVEPDSPAALAEIPVGAIIWAIDGQDVNTPEGVENRLRAAGAGTRVLLTFHFAGKVERRYVDLGGFQAARLDNALPDLAPTVPGPLPPGGGQPTSPRSDPDPLIDTLESRLDAMEAKLSRLETLLEQVLQRQGLPAGRNDTPKFPTTRPSGPTPHRGQSQGASDS